MTNLTRAVAVCLRVLQADRALARRQVSASVAMILLARVGDVDGLGLLVFVGPQFLAGQELGAQQETGAPGGK